MAFTERQGVWISIQVVDLTTLDSAEPILLSDAENEHTAPASRADTTDAKLAKPKRARVKGGIKLNNFPTKPECVPH